MTTPVTTLGGIVLEGESSYDWQLQRGVAPFRAHYTVTIDCAKQLAGLIGQPLTFKTVGPRATGEYQKIYLLEILPAATPFQRILHLADLRWRWPYAHLVATFNKRRITGDKFLLNDQGDPANAITDPKQIYEPTTLFPFGIVPGERVWTAREVLNYLLTTPEPFGLGEVVDFRFPGSGVEIQDARGVYDDSGDAAIERALMWLAGIDLFVDRNGNVVVDDTRSVAGETTAIATRFGRLATGPESLEVDRAAIRPSKIVHLFTVDAELRCDFDESGTQPRIDVDDPTLFNVAEVTDQSLSVGGKTLARGSYAKLIDLMEAWGSFGRPELTMTLAHLRALYMEHNGARIENVWSRDGAGNVSPVSYDRVAEVLASWRKKYRIAPTFFGRLESMAPVRVAILNPETGTRAPSPVYCDFIRRPRMRLLMKTQGQTVANGAAVDAHDGGNITSSTRAAPARVRIADAEVGVIEIHPKLDPEGLFDSIVLGYPVGGVFPTIAGIPQANVTRNAAFVNWSFVKLDPDFDLAVILSVTPGTPQNINRFYAIETAIPNGKGPVLYSRIDPGITPARFAWNDARREDIIGAIRGQVSWSTLRNLLVNEEHLIAVAAADAERIKDVFRDRTFGGHDVDLAPELEPIGSLDSVRHIMASGATVSQLRWPRDTRRTDIWRYMDSGVRVALRRILHAAPHSRGS